MPQNTLGRNFFIYNPKINKYCKYDEKKFLVKIDTFSYPKSKKSPKAIKLCKVENWGNYHRDTSLIWTLFHDFVKLILYVVMEIDTNASNNVLQFFKVRKISHRKFLGKTNKLNIICGERLTYAYSSP